MSQATFVLMLIAAIGFSLNPIVAQSLSGEISSSGFILLRFLFVVIFLPIIAVVMSETDFKSFFSITAKGAGQFLILSLFFAGNMLLFYFSFNYIPVNRAMFIFFTYPVFSVIFARIFLKEKATIEELVAVALTLVGAGIIFGTDGFGGDTLVGDVMVLISAVMWAGYVVLNRYTALREIHYRQTFWLFLFSSLLILPFFVFFDYTPIMQISVTTIYALLAFGFISNLLPYSIMNYTAKHMRSTVVGLFILLSMVLTIFLSIIFLEEPTTPNVIFGGVLILIASMISIMSFKSVFLLNHRVKTKIKESKLISIVKKTVVKEIFRKNT